MDDSIVVEQFKALGDPVRWAIVREVGTGTRCACELSDVVEVSPPLLSHHLRVLREAGLGDEEIEALLEAGVVMEQRAEAPK